MTTTMTTLCNQRKDGARNNKTVQGPKQRQQNEDNNNQPLGPKQQRRQKQQDGARTKIVVHRFATGFFWRRLLIAQNWERQNVEKT